MWRAYAPTGVVVRSSFARLCQAVKAAETEVFIGFVNYRALSREMTPDGIAILRAFYKRREYAGESELRVAVHSPTELSHGFRLPIDVSSLIESVHLSPLADEWFLPTLRQLVKDRRLDFPVEPSALRAERQPKWLKPA